MNQIIQPKILKGTRDFLPEDMAKRNFVMEQIRKVFEKYGYDTIETPVIAYAETILGKYGDDGDRLTYSFEDSGGRRIALPYDLTVPFARLVAANWQDLPMPFKRYQIQRVWRAEKPQKGRLREFYQCDIDVIGTKSLIAEAEIARVVVDVFKELGFEDFKLKINSRRLMNAILESLGVLEDAPAVIRSIDKMDKIGEEGVREELEKKGFDSGKISRLFKVLAEKDFADYDTSEIYEFLQLCKDFKIDEEYLEFDPYLARGLDYYTGITYEVICDEAGLGSLCGGGRYDDLCGLFCKEDFSGVGVAFGFERIMIALEKMGKLKKIPLNSKVLVTVFDEESSGDALGIYTSLIEAGINSEVYFEPDKLSKQFKYANKKKISFVVVRGSQERAKNEVTIKIMETGRQKTIPENQLISYIKGYV
ncbi:MAG: histidine--tRNA ligase [Patescibacteria group bacterium]|nr:histidine--tRNA ligase [Patescibacteria group bacterium]